MVMAETQRSPESVRPA